MNADKDSGGSGGGSPVRQWSSLIGIVTAICGNVLISIALNTQRYAHIRIREKWQRQKKSVRQAQERAQRGERGYGTHTNGYKKPGGGAVGERARGRARTEEGDEEESRPLLSNEDGTGTENDARSEESPDDVPEKSYLKSPLWWAGQVMMTIGEAGNFLAYGFAPASIVSPLGVVALVSNCIIAPFFLKEHFRLRDFFGVVVAVSGAVTVALSAENNNPKLGPDQIWQLIATWEFETYLAITSAVIIVLMFASNKYGDKSILIDLGLVGLFGGYTALSTKGVASLLSDTLLEALTFPLTYLLVAVLVGTAVMQIKYLNRALRRFNATQVIPTQFVLFTLSVILGSAVLYRDFERTPGGEAGKFVTGCALTFTGVWLITSGRTHEDEDDGEEDYGGEEEAIPLSQEEISRRISNMSSHEVRKRSVNGIARRPSARQNYSRHSAGPDPLPIITPRRKSSRFGPDQSPSLTGESPRLTPATGTIPFPDLEPPTQPLERVSSAGQRTVQTLLKPLSSLFGRDGPARPPYTLGESTSVPILPTEARVNPSTPTTPQIVTTQADTPDDPLPQNALLPRPSFSDFFPGPLAGTWSSPLSAIVADSLRRGIDTALVRPRRGPRVQKLPGMPWKAGLRERGNSDTDADHVVPDQDIRDLYLQSPTFRDEDEVSAAPWAEDGLSATPNDTRIRRLSHAFGELFRWRSAGRLGGDDVEANRPPDREEDGEGEESGAER